ncbi:MAG: sterol carrier family protein [Microbacteriaceae bacterium]
MPLPRIPDADGRAAVRTVWAGDADRATTALAVRWLLQELSRIAPGKSVEVRVPPFGAVQIVEGPGHTRGTPPNVIETDASTIVALAVGTESWVDAVARGAVLASGTRATLQDLLPLHGLSE